MRWVVTLSMMTGDLPADATPADVRAVAAQHLRELDDDLLDDLISLSVVTPSAMLTELPMEPLEGGT